MAEKQFISLSLGQKRGFSHFVPHVNVGVGGQEVKRSFDPYWWAELNFGQELVFLEAYIFNLFPKKLFSNY